MKKNKALLIGMMSVLLLVITIHVALLVKNRDGSADFFNQGAATSNESMEWSQPILLIALQPAPGGT
jgi:hypothetical protein